jgi:hypothetical protein
MTDQPVEQTADKTIATGATAGGDVPQTWPDSWRQEILGGEEYIKSNADASKELERLQNFKSPNDIYKSFRSIEKEFSKRAPRMEFKEGMSEADLAKYRQQEGIPNSPKEYKLEFDNGLVVGENDKPLVDGFLDYAHKKNMPESYVKSAIEWYLSDAENSSAKMAQMENDHKLQTLSSLKAEWGPEFQGNINAINELFIDAPEIKDILLTARGPDGLPIGNVDSVIRWAVGLSKKVNPMASFTLPGGENGFKALESRLGELKNIMTTDRERWFKSPDLQSEYDELVAKRDAVKR